MRSLTTLLACGIAIAAASASAQAEDEGEDEELIADRIHSNLPLFTFDWEDLWPRNFRSEDSFGCTSRVGFGDWRFEPSASDEYGEEFWDRYRNYGVFHCAAILQSARERVDLEEADYDYGFFVRLGQARLELDEWELWAIQQGMVPGSDYILLAREAGEKGLVEKFVLLQQRCPSGKILEVEGMDVWTTRYCAVNSREELVALANQMLQLPPRGVLQRMPDIDENEVPEDGSDTSSE